MNIQSIEDEIIEFNNRYFYETTQIVEGCLDFIQNNNLIIPKANYAIVTDFLAKMVKNFRVLDSKFMTNNMSKLLNDIKILQASYKQLPLTQSEVLQVFKAEFIPFSPLLSSMAKELLELHNLKEKSDDEIVYQKRATAHFKELKDIYYELFIEIFSDDKKYFQKTIKEILNSKSFYLDKLIWLESEKSIVLKKHFKILKMQDKLNTKSYLLYTTEMMRQYTDEYRYLQSCLRIYK